MNARKQVADQLRVAAELIETDGESPDLIFAIFEMDLVSGKSKECIGTYDSIDEAVVDFKTLWKTGLPVELDVTLAKSLTIRIPKASV